MSMAPQSPRRWLTFFAILLTAIYGAGIWQIAIVHEGTRYVLLYDDAMISMRYASNLIAGHGLVWNVGELVQGYTNLGWTLWMAFCQIASPTRELAGGAVIAVNFLLHLSLLFLIFKTTAAQKLSPPSSILAQLFLIASPTLLFWGLGGMETTAIALTLSIALFAASGFLQVEHPRALATGAFLLTLVIRADAILFLPGLMAAWMLRVNGTYLWKLRAALSLLFFSAVAYAAILGWQWRYYGVLFPNTAALKIGTGARELDRGFEYIGRFFVSVEGSLLLLSLILFAARSHTRRRAALALTPAVFFQIAYTVWAGGDPFPQFRFLAALIPAIALLLGLGVDGFLDTLPRVTPRMSPIARWAMPAAVVVCSVSLLWQTITAANQAPEWKFQRDMVRVAVRLKPELTEDSLTATFFAGTVPYLLPEHRFHDALGKTNRYIARTTAKYGPPGHNKWDFTYSLSFLKPDFLITGFPYNNRDEGELLEQVIERADYGFEGELFFHPEFRARYWPNFIETGAEFVELYRRQ